MSNVDGCNITSDLIKVSVFGSPGRGGKLGTECLWDIARKCNRRAEEAARRCGSSAGRKRTVNFVTADFPNYPAGKARDSLREIVFRMNHENVRAYLT